MTDASTHSRMLGEGPGRCEFCYGSYGFELELVCVDCDRPMCPFCSIRLRSRRVACPDCEPPRERD